MLQANKPVSFISAVLLFVVSVIFQLKPCPAFADDNFFVMPRGGNILRTVNPVNGDTTGLAAMNVESGSEIVASNGLAVHPTTKDLWAIFQLRNQSGRFLAKIDPATGLVNIVGNTSRNIASIAFNTDGSVLYGVTGNAGSNTHTLFSINQSTAATTLLCAFGDTSFGEALALNPNDGLLYRITEGFFQRVDNPSGATCSVTTISTTSIGEATAMVWSTDLNAFMVSEFSSLVSYQTNGTETFLFNLPESAKGLGFSDKTTPTLSACPPVADMYTVLTDSPDTLVAVDRNTGALTFVGQFSNVEFTTGLAFGATGKLYGVGYRISDSKPVLYEVNPCTGEDTIIGPIDDPDNSTVQDIAFNSSGTLFLYDARKRLLRNLNLSNATTTNVGTKNLISQNGGNGLTFLTDGTLLLGGDDVIISLSPTTSQPISGVFFNTETGNFTGFDSVKAMTTRFGTSDTVYGIVDNSFGTIDPAQSVYNRVTTWNSNFYGLANYQDTDGDGTLDFADECRSDQSKTSAGQCGCGSADTDSDNDGKANCVDACPSDANKSAAGVCGCGVSDADANGNGVADCLDPTAATVPTAPTVQLAKGVVTVSFQEVPGATYTMTLTRKGVKKPKTVTSTENPASVRKLPAGSWSVSYTITLGAVTTQSSAKASFKIKKKKK